MRIVVDLQGAQTESRFRGIGRYSLALTLALARNRGPHELLVALNGAFPEAIEPIRQALLGFVARADIRIWEAPRPVREVDPDNHTRRQTAERIREAFLLGLEPDVVVVTSLFEGLGDDAVTSIGVWTDAIPTAVVLYDLIPLISPDVNFQTNPVYIDWYTRKVESLRRAQVLLAISESARQEAIDALPADPNDVVDIYGACDDRFRFLNFDRSSLDTSARSIGITRPFIMYTGGADERKNLPRLLRAYAGLPEALQQGHQLVFVGKMPNVHVEVLRQLAGELKIIEAVVFTGYVDDDLLVRLYHACEVFVFPSLHEGLGLPPMEAMSCGAPVLASHATSLRQVVGNPDALFDPFDVPAMTSALCRILTDPDWRAELVKRAKHQAETFDWDQTARRAFAALERLGERHATSSRLHAELLDTSRYHSRPIRILVVKLDHRGDLLLSFPAVARLRARFPHANIEALVGTWNVELANRSGFFAKVHAFDFFGSSSLQQPERRDALLADVVLDLGHVDLAIDMRRQADTRFVLARIHAAVRVGYESFDRATDQLLTVRLPATPDVPFETTYLNRTHITEQMLALIDAVPASALDYVDLPLLAGSPPSVPARQKRVALFPAAGNAVKQWPSERFAAVAGRLCANAEIAEVVLLFGNEAEAAEFGGLPINGKVSINVGLPFEQLIDELKRCSVCVANNSFGAHLAGYLGCTVIGVYGGHETAEEWSPPFGASYVLRWPVPCSPCHISSVDKCLRNLECLRGISIDDVVTCVVAALEGRIGAIAVRSPRPTSSSPAAIVDRLSRDLRRAQRSITDPRERVEIARCISANHRLIVSVKQLLVDVSELVRHDARSGIQRVVRAVLAELLRDPPSEYCVKLVHVIPGTIGYHYANAFERRFLGLTPDDSTDDSPAETWPGDVFIGLDLHPLGTVAQAPIYRGWQARGIKVCFVAYDLLPVRMPEFFPPGTADAHHRWLDCIARSDGVLAISRAVSDEFVEWLQHRGPHRLGMLPVAWFHLGADLGNSVPSLGLPPSAESLMAQMRESKAFLMVGTLEPRKGHTLALAAFERLWAAGHDAMLVIVGKTGWMVDELVARLRSHPELGRRLHWIEGGSDEYLQQLYDRSAALLAASEGEGFGLPLIEAAQRGVRVVARDIPVFREVADGYASFFPRSANAEALAEFVEHWTASQSHVPQCEPSVRSWKDCTKELVRLLLSENWPVGWRRDDVRRFWGAESRMYTVVGRCEGLQVHSTGRPGQLLYGPYADLASGTYVVHLRGTARTWSGEDLFDAVRDQGRILIFHRVLNNLPIGAWSVTATVVLSAPVHDFEVRVAVGAGADITIDELEIQPLRTTAADAHFERIGVVEVTVP